MTATTDRWEIFWKGRRVGVMREPRFDTWVYFGKWHCSDADVFNDLCLALRKNGEAEVRCNGRPALMVDAPTAEATIMFTDDWPGALQFDEDILDDLPPEDPAGVQTQICCAE